MGFAVLLCSCSPAPSSPSVPAPAVSATPSPTATPTPASAAPAAPGDVSSWLGEWGSSQYSCTVGEMLTDDGIRIEKGAQAEELKLTLYLSTVLPATVTGRLLTADRIEIPERELNGGPASGSLSRQDNSVQHTKTGCGKAQIF